MPAPYSDDFRQKALAAVDRKEEKTQICRTFGISRNTLHTWLKRREQTGSVAAVQNYRRGPKPKIDDLEKFRAFAEAHGRLTQKEMARLWPEPVSNRTIGKALEKIGFTRKKNLWLPREG